MLGIRIGISGRAAKPETPADKNKILLQALRGEEPSDKLNGS
jgi:hypothetical protein